MCETLPQLRLRTGTRPCQPSYTLLRDEISICTPRASDLEREAASWIRWEYGGVQLVAHKSQAIKEMPRDILYHMILLKCTAESQLFNLSLGAYLLIS